MSDVHRPPNGSVQIYEHWQAGGVVGHNWDVFFGDGSHRAFDKEQLAWDAATQWGTTHKVSVWITATKGTTWRLVPNPKLSSLD